MESWSDRGARASIASNSAFGSFWNQAASRAVTLDGSRAVGAAVEAAGLVDLVDPGNVFRNKKKDRSVWLICTQAN